MDDSHRQPGTDLTFDNLQAFFAEGRVKTPAPLN